MIRSIEAWPDQDILVDLKAECGAGLQVPPLPPRDGRLDLLAWWLLRERGMRPFGGEANHKEHPAYGVLVNTRVGYPIFMALRAAEFMTRDGNDPCPAYVEAMRQNFDESWELTDAHFYRDGWKIIRVASNYDPGQQPEVWGYVHPCVFNYVRKEMLKTHDPIVHVSGYHVGDRFRLRLKQALAQPNALGPLMVAAGDAASPIDELEDTKPRSGRGIRDVLASFSLTCRVAFLISHMPLGGWTEGAISDLAHECKVPARALRDFILKREDRVVLAWRRTEACKEKAEYGSALIEKTEHSLTTALARQGLSPEEAESRIISLKKQGAAPGVHRNKLPTVPRGGVSADSVEFLEPWLQDCSWRRERMRRYAERFGKERFEFSTDEYNAFGQMFGCTRRQIDECIATVKRAIEQWLNDMDGNQRFGRRKD